MEPLLIDVGELLAEHGASFAVTLKVDLDTLFAHDTEFVPRAPAAVDVTLSHAGAGIVATGTVDADFMVECARCLVPFELHVIGEVEGFYVESPDEVWSEEEDAEPMTGGRIDLAPAIDSAIRVELPFAPVHAEDCAGICPQCGCDLNAGRCDCDWGVQAEGPFAALRHLIAPESDDEEGPGESGDRPDHDVPR